MCNPFETEIVLEWETIPSATDSGLKAFEISGFFGLKRVTGTVDCAGFAPAGNDFDCIQR